MEKEIALLSWGRKFLPQGVVSKYDRNAGRKRASSTRAVLVDELCARFTFSGELARSVFCFPCLFCSKPGLLRTSSSPCNSCRVVQTLRNDEANVQKCDRAEDASDPGANGAATS